MLSARTAPAPYRASGRGFPGVKTLKTAISIARRPGTDINRALSGLVGCPAGGWGETAQAYRRVEEATPHPSERDWRVDALVSAVLAVDDTTGRYRWRR